MYVGHRNTAVTNPNLLVQCFLSLPSYPPQLSMIHSPYSGGSGRVCALCISVIKPLILSLESNQLSRVLGRWRWWWWWGGEVTEDFSQASVGHKPKHPNSPHSVWSHLPSSWGKPELRAAYHVWLFSSPFLFLSAEKYLATTQ